MRLLQWLNNRFIELFCRHEWKQHVVNLQVEGDIKVTTLGWHDCHKCGASKIDFIYG